MTVTKVTVAALIHSSVHPPSSYSAPTMLQVSKVTLTGSCPHGAYTPWGRWVNKVEEVPHQGLEGHNTEREQPA